MKSNGRNQDFVLNNESTRSLNYSVLDSIAEFYNAYEDEFREFDAVTGMDIWFLEHFRLYFRLRNLSYRIRGTSGSSSPLASDVPIDILGNMLTPKTNVGKPRSIISYLRKGGRVVREIKFMLKLYIRNIRSSRGQCHYQSMPLVLVPLSNFPSRANKLFGDLLDHYPPLYSRNLLYLQEKVQQLSEIPVDGPNSDDILVDYFFRFRWPLHMWNFHKALRRLSRSVSSKLDYRDEESKLIFRLFWRSRFAFYLFHIRFKSFLRFFEGNRPPCIVLTDENSPSSKLVMYAADHFRIPCFALQHGAIHDLHPAYMYGRYHRTPILALKTYTWGKHYEDLLVHKGGYPRERVCTVGRVQQLILDPGKETPVFAKKPVILYASQPQRDPTMRLRQLEDVIWVSSRLDKQFQLIIRPHPSETEDYHFLQAAAAVGVSNIMIDRRTDLHTHFYQSDFLITSFSTVGSEYIPYYKPLLVLDYLEQDLVGYIREGVGVKIRSREDLLHYFIKQDFDINRKSYDRFITNYFYRNDGRASLRIRKNIECHVKQVS